MSERFEDFFYGTCCGSPFVVIRERIIGLFIVAQAFGFFPFELYDAMEIGSEKIPIVFRSGLFPDGLTLRSGTSDVLGQSFRNSRDSVETPAPLTHVDRVNAFRVLNQVRSLDLAE